MSRPQLQVNWVCVRSKTGSLHKLYLNTETYLLCAFLVVSLYTSLYNGPSLGVMTLNPEPKTLKPQTQNPKPQGDHGPCPYHLRVRYTGVLDPESTLGGPYLKDHETK